MKNASSGGIGFMGALFLLFLALKLCGVIGWSWWLVTAPLWGPPALLLAALIASGTLFLVCWVLLKAVQKRKGKYTIYRTE